MVWARGGPNRIKDGIHPLDGLVETNWLPFSFTMNWKFTRPGAVTFAKGEPFCLITMTPSVAIEAVQPVILSMEDDPISTESTRSGTASDACSMLASKCAMN
jgi:hypothetical protein